jgi:hypothetical protein
LKKKEVIAKRHGIGAFSLYVQIKIKQIFTRSRAKNLKELKKPTQEQENVIMI